MKKFLLSTLLVLFVIAGLSSCRSHERCAAYGKVNKIDTSNTLQSNTANKASSSVKF